MTVKGSINQCCPELPSQIKVLLRFSKYLQKMLCTHKILESECKAHQVQKNILNPESSCPTIPGSFFNGDPRIRE